MFSKHPNFIIIYLSRLVFGSSLRQIQKGFCLFVAFLGICRYLIDKKSRKNIRGFKKHVTFALSNDGNAKQNRSLKLKRKQ